MESKISQDPKSLLSDLNEAQFEAVTYGNGPLLIVAGAGTGKTTAITRKLAWLILEKGIKTSEILALTFTEKAAFEMEERVDKLLPYGYVELWVSTFHAFAERILRAHALELGISSDFKLFDSTATWLMVRKNLNRFALKYYRPLGNPSKFIHALIAHFNRAKDELISPQDYLLYAENIKLNIDSEIIIGGSVINGDLRGEEISRIEELANAYHVYEQLLIENNAMDFGNLIMKTVELLKSRPLVLQKYRDQFKFILVDEFQDTNIAQYELVKILAAPQNNLTVVGDDDQSVYKFRGASISNILEFKKDFPDAKEIFLTKNYRSSQNVLDLAYNFIKQNNPNRLEYRLGADKLSKQLFSSKESQGQIEHLHAANAHGEVGLVLEKIAEIKSNDPQIFWSDFAILVRANDHANLFIRALEKAKIPYELVTARGLYTSPVILDLVSYLKVISNYHDNPSFYRAITSSVSEFTDPEVIDLLYWANRKNWSLYTTLKNSSILGLTEDLVRKCNYFLGRIEKYAASGRKFSVSRLFYNIIEDEGYLKLLISENSENSQKQLKNLNQFYKKTLLWESENKNSSIKDFLGELEFEIESGEEGKIDFNPDDGPESVKILTCHAAKGLEFKYVFITNLVDRRFPTTERSDAIELPDALIKETLPEGDIHLEEERRLFYVACTRAKEGLFFTSASDYGGTRKKKLSRFLHELSDLNLIKLSDEDSSQKNIIDIEKKSVENNEKVVEVSNLKSSYFSFTQLKAFESCPLQYKYAHILKIPVKGRPTFSFGKSIHATLQKFIELVKERKQRPQASLFQNEQSDLKEQVDDVITFDTLLDIYKKSWIEDWYDNESQKDEYYKKGKDMLKLFFDEYQKSVPSPLYTEKSFSLKIGDYIIKGVIDRIDLLQDGTFEIIDYKTGRSRAENSVDKDQLYIYQMALEDLFQIKPSKLTYYFVEDGVKVSFLGTSENLLKTKEKIISSINEIKTSTFPPTPAKEKCTYCDFKGICGNRIL